MTANQYRSVPVAGSDGYAKELGSARLSEAKLIKYVRCHVRRSPRGLDDQPLVTHPCDQLLFCP